MTWWYAAVRGVFAPAQYKRELLIGPDGGTVGLDWHRADAKLPDTAPILLILHGVTGLITFVVSACATLMYDMLHAQRHLKPHNDGNVGFEYSQPVCMQCVGKLLAY